MVTLKYLILYVTFSAVCVKHTVCVYDAAESEVYTKYDEELLTTSMSKNEDDYQNGDVTTVEEESATTAQDITTSNENFTTTDPETTTAEYLTVTITDDPPTTVKNLSSTVKRFIYRTKCLNLNGTAKKTDVQAGKVYTILESFINEPDGKKYKEDGDFEDTTEEIATAPYYEVTTNSVDYFDNSKSIDSDKNETDFDVVKNPLCPRFIDGTSFEMDKIANVWQPVYSDLEEKLPCFKILIRKTLDEERNQYEQWYGNFNESMNWKECLYEIKSAAVKYRKHFLQGGVGDKGIMRNILLVRNRGGDYDLAEESPDQWITVKNLLLLHDCKTGETIVFARVPSHPCKAVISEALQELGLNTTGDMLLCYT